MRMERMIDRTIWGIALVLGQASALWGAMLTLGWAVGFVLIISTKTHSDLRLSAAPPLIGLAVAGLSLVIAQKSRTVISQYALAGLVFNLVALMLAVAVLFF